MNEHSQQTKEWAGVGKLDQLVSELERQKESRIDACMDTRQVIVSTSNREEGGLSLLPVGGTQTSEFLSLSQGTPFQTKALKQLGSRLTPNL